MKIKRSVARRVVIKDLVNGNYFKEQNFMPNYVLTNYGLRVARALIVGTVTDVYKTEEYGSITIDDGTSSIRVKFFQDLSKMADVKPGDIIEVIGKPREYNNELYIVPESILKVDFNRELLRKIEHKKFIEKWKEILEKAENMIKNSGNIDKEELGIDDLDAAALNRFINSKGKELVRDIASERIKVLEEIKKLDKGEGADYSDIEKAVGLSPVDLDKIITELLEEGSCFEPKPGKIKVL
jgi:RPA family protein